MQGNAAVGIEYLDVTQNDGDPQLIADKDDGDNQGAVNDSHGVLHDELMGTHMVIEALACNLFLPADVDMICRAELRDQLLQVISGSLETHQG